MKKVAVTFDLDFTDYVGGGDVGDELEKCWPVFLDCCSQIPPLVTTWFIRIDEHMKNEYGSADFIFQKHREKIEWLRANGHEVAWHFHSYRQINGVYKQNADDLDVSQELERMYPLAQMHNLELLRMGWAYHTQNTFETIEKLGITIDCTAFPRPKYSWDNQLRDWTNTPQHGYYPSKSNYRVQEDEHLNVLELPITTVEIPLPTDTEPAVLRYINPAYHSNYFKAAIMDVREDIFNIISHPYEFLPNPKSHVLISFNSAVFIENISWISNLGMQFITMKEYAVYQNNTTKK
jgi:hypothetical protein